VVSDAIASGCCELLEWDSAFFGVRIGRVRGHRLSDDTAAAALEWASREAVECLYFLADAADDDTVRAAERHAFALTDVRFELAASIVPGRLDLVPSVIRPAQASDLGRLSRLARTSHRNTRFYADAHFDRQRCDDLYALWLERSFSGELADVVFVPEVDGAPAGYVTVRRTPNGTARVGLVAIDPARRGAGHGAGLLAAAKQWCAARDIRQLTVVTQGRNAAAVRFYERAGFAAESVGFWYHRWSSHPSG
jgi:dTDP-4-amino-4,6-dideoxy-D-galactose acyltransferase